jgi:hypothetical protein
VAGVDAVRDVADTLVFLLRAGGSLGIDPSKITVATPDAFESLRDPSARDGFATVSRVLLAQPNTVAPG